MNVKSAWIIGTGLMGLSVLMQPAVGADGSAAAQKHKAVIITRLFSGPDGQTHAEEIDAKFSPAGGNDVYKLMANSGAEIHRAPPGRVA